MTSFIKWGTGLVAIWIAAFFLNWAIHGGDPFGLIFLELAATAVWLIAWASWTLFARFRRPDAARTRQTEQTPAHLWIVAAFVGLWYAYSALNQFVLPPGGTLAGNVDHPSWLDATWALILVAGIAGSVLLARRSRHAMWVFAVSLAAVMVAAVYQSGISLGPDPALRNLMLFAAVSLAIPFALLVYAWRMRARGFLRQGGKLGVSVEAAGPKRGSAASLLTQPAGSLRGSRFRRGRW